MRIKNKFVMVTSSENFIAAAVVKQLLIDHMNFIEVKKIDSYYSQRLKHYRLHLEDIKSENVEATAANTALLKDWIEFTAKTKLKFLKMSINLYKKYY